MTPASRPSASPTFTVVMPVYNGRGYLERTVPALLDALARVDGHLVVMDNGSTDGSLQWLRENARTAEVHCAPGLTIGALRNAGASRGEGRLLSFLDADCLVPPDYFLQVTEVFKDSGAEAVGSVYALPEDALWIERDWHALNRRHHNAGGAPVAYVPAGNFACEREVFEAVGGFDENLITGEDTELCLRLRNHGATVWGSERIEARHLGNPKSLRGFFRKQRWHAQGMFGTARLQLLDRPTLLTVAHVAANVVGLALLMLIGGLIGAVSFVGLTSFAPTLALGYRVLQKNRPRSIWRALLLFHLYLDARAAALGSILLRRSTRRG